MPRHWPLVPCVFLAFLCGCGPLTWKFTTQPPPPTPQPVIAVSIIPITANVAGLQSQLFTAQVTGTANTAVTWSVSGSGCSGAGCGSIASNGVYKAPETVPTAGVVTVTAASAADSSKTAIATVNVLPAPPVEISITPKTARVLQNKSVSYAALVSNSRDTEVAWAITGNGCTGAACGGISPAGVYTAPVPVPVPNTVTVTATSQADPTKTDQATVTVVDTAGALITGTYTYLLSGFNAAGGVAAVGAITFYADGTFSANENSVFSSGGSSAGVWSGNYIVGDDGRGTITGNGVSIPARVLHMSVLPNDEIRFVQFNSTGQRASGLMRRTDVNATLLAGDWAFETSGTDFSGAPMGMIGELQFDVSGSIAGSFILQDYQTMTQGLLRGSYIPPVNGRSDLQLQGLGQTLNWALYIANENEMFFVTNGSADPLITQLSGRLLRRSGAPYAAEFLDSATVLSLRGLNVASAGQLAFDGAISGSGTIDLKEDIGSITLDAAATTQFALGINGCGTITIQVPGDSPQFKLCLISPNEAFILQSTSSTSNQSFIGKIDPQIGPFSSVQLDGTYYFGSELPINSTVGLASGFLVNAGGTLSGVADITLANGDTAAQVLSGSITSFDASTGRGTATLNIPGMANTVFYATSSGQFTMLPLSQLPPGTDGVQSLLTLRR